MLQNRNVEVNFPVFCKITDKEEIEDLNARLLEAIQSEQPRITLSEIDIVGSTEVFNYNDATYQIKYRGQEIITDELSFEVLQRFASDNGYNLSEIITDVKVVQFYNSEPVVTKSIIELIDYTVSDRKSIISKGIWYKYNDDYLQYLSNSIREIDVRYLPEYNYSKKAHDEYINQKYLEERNNQKFLGLQEHEVKNKLRNKYYTERYYNIFMSSFQGYQLYDRHTCRINANKIELMDLYKDKCMYAVKFGSSSEKLCYVVDQSIQAIKIYKHNLIVDKPQINEVALMIVLERANDLPIVDGVPDINRLDMLTLKNKIDYWKKEVRVLGYKPIIYINYTRD